LKFEFVIVIQEPLYFCDCKLAYPYILNEKCLVCDLELNGTHERLVDVANVNLLGENINSIKENKP